MALELQPLSKIYLHSSAYDYDVQTQTSDIRVVYIFSLIAIFTLLIACINFMNLATARSERRMREVGMRKVIGATKIQLIRQFISESILMAFLAMFIAVFLVELLLPFFNSIFIKHMSFIKSFNIVGMLVLLAFVLFTGFIAGSYPAFFLSSFLPINSLQGKQKKGNEKSLIRKLLVVGQFTVSIVLIIMTTVLYKQLHFMQHKKLGYDKERMVSIPMSQEIKSRYEALKNSFLESSDVVSFTAADNLPNWQGPSYYLEEWEGRNTDKIIKMHECTVDYDYFKTFDMEIIQGRTFSRDFSTDMDSALLINEEAARQMNMTAPVGKHLGSSENERQIIGVVKDFHHDSLRNRIQPMTFQLDPENTNYLIFRLSTGVLPEKLVYLEDKWKKIILNHPFSYYFLDQVLNRNYQPEIIIGKAISFFSILAILIASLGLFGLAAFTAEQSTKEIGIRKILGASSLEIFTLLAKDFTLRVAAAGIIALPLSYLGAVTFLKNYAFRTSLGVLVFILPILASLFLALLIVSYQSIRASLINPSTFLRYE
ncbi:MAG: FtsX-like permease family protein [Candidatus Aminicenantes bacterium]|nr:FtsX-like permease family protein [Candidatus Aminicenantes bacterium]